MAPNSSWQANPSSPFPARKTNISRRGSQVSSSTWLKWLRYGTPLLLGAAALAVIGGALFAWSGLYNVGASAGHLPITRDFLQYVMKQSVAFHAPHLKPPPLDDPKLILRGATHYHTGCAPCHGARGTQVSPIERSATPPAPPLYDMARTSGLRSAIGLRCVCAFGPRPLKKRGYQRAGATSATKARSRVRKKGLAD
jgi:hypothetical protein